MLLIFECVLKEDCYLIESKFQRFNIFCMFAFLLRLLVVFKPFLVLWFFNRIIEKVKLTGD